jgi:peptidoglycan hydrolase-like protein with peptidoglycan-binding domain
MFLASKIVCSGIVFLLMTPWISGPRPRPLDSGANLSRELVLDGSWSSKEPNETPGDYVKEMQQTLQDKGHYGGKVDGVFGLRTRESVRQFQKAVSLPVTGQLDVWTAGKLGVRPEYRRVRGYETSQHKPSAGIKWARGSRRSSKTLQKIVEKSASTVPPV